MTEVFVAIRCEELPARFIDSAVDQLANRLVTTLKGIPHGAIRKWSTPRRIAVAIENVAIQSPVEEKLVTGPPIAAAFRNGEATKAAIGFARSKGVAVEDLITTDTPRGPVIAARTTYGGELTRDRLREKIESIVLGMDFPKTMKWGEGHYKWARPIHGLILMIDGDVVEAEVAGIQSANKTVGHRLKPDPFAVDSADDWVEKLRERWVEPDVEARRQIIRAQLNQEASKRQAEIRDWDLVDETVHLVEWPQTIVAEFDSDLLQLPPKLLVESMKVHQRVFPLYAKNALQNAFLAVSNQPYATDPEVASRIAEGNTRVLTARFYDAKFFYAEDRKKTIADHGAKLEGMRWVRNGGTMADKVKRIANVAEKWAPQFKADPDECHRAGLLCKNDLCTMMVTEFPKLQGHVGRLLAGFDGEKPNVAKALEDHYLPKHAGDKIASDPVSQTVACADRWDSLTGCFALNLQPKGSGDPLGLRRAANGLLSTLIQSNTDIDLKGLTAELENGEKLLQFLMARLRSLFQEKTPTDIVNAVMSTKDTDPVALNARIDAMRALAKTENYADLRATFKRVMGLAKEHDSIAVDPKFFVVDAEKTLSAAVTGAVKEARNAAAKKDYKAALSSLGSLKADVDAFFDAVLVMDNDLNIRNNRLSLLNSIAVAFGEIADFTQLSTET